MSIYFTFLLFVLISISKGSYYCRSATLEAVGENCNKVQTFGVSQQINCGNLGEYYGWSRKYLAVHNSWVNLWIDNQNSHQKWTLSFLVYKDGRTSVQIYFTDSSDNEYYLGINDNGNFEAIKNKAVSARYLETRNNPKGIQIGKMQKGQFYNLCPGADGGYVYASKDKQCYWKIKSDDCYEYDYSQRVWKHGSYGFF